MRYGFAALFIAPLLGYADEKVQLGNTSVFDAKNQNAAVKMSKSNQTRLRFESANYLQSLPGTPLKQMDAIFFELKHISHSQTRTGIDFVSGNYTNIPSSFFYFNEIYYGYSLSSDTRIDIGRKREHWAEFDNDWYLGLWEPRANWDPLRPFDQGLAGIFLQSRFDDFDLLLFASPLFLPTVGPEIAEKNGSLISQSRWYRTPVSSGLVLDRETRFFYSLEVPEIAKLAQQSSFGTRLSYRFGKTGFWYSAAIARKPLNALSIRYDYNLAVTSSFSQAEVRVTPTVSYHDLATLELGWQGDDNRMLLSLFADDVSSPTPKNQVDSQGNNETDWLQQNPSSAAGGAIKFETQQNIIGLSAPIDLSIGYLHTNVAKNVDRDEAGTQRGSLFPDRFNWARATQIYVRSRTSFLKKPLFTQIRWMRELNQRGTLVSVQNALNLNTKFALHLNIDVLGVDDSSITNSDPGFFNQFRTNDRIYGGVSYVF